MDCHLLSTNFTLIHNTHTAIWPATAIYMSTKGQRKIILTWQAIIPEIIVDPDFYWDSEVWVADSSSSLAHHISHQFWFLYQTGTISFSHGPSRKKKLLMYIYFFWIQSIFCSKKSLISYGKQSILADMNFISIWIKILSICLGKTSTYIWYKLTSGDIHSLNPLHQNIWNQIMRTWLLQYHIHILTNYGYCFVEMNDTARGQVSPKSRMPNILYLECKNQTVRKHIAGVTYGETISAAAAKSLPLLAANCTMSGLSAKIIHCKWKKTQCIEMLNLTKLLIKKYWKKCSSKCCKTTYIDPLPQTNNMLTN